MSPTIPCTFTAPALHLVHADGSEPSSSVRTSTPRSRKRWPTATPSRPATRSASSHPAA